MSNADLAWFAERTAAAPELLRDRAEEYVRDIVDAEGVSRLAAAGSWALGAAIATGEDRAAALDLLAADALITLALLAQAERDPAELAAVARALRLRATT